MLKQYNIDDDAVLTADAKSSNWGPNAMFTGTHDEFMEHIRSIEAGNFTPWEEAKKELNEWKKEYLANRMK